MMGRCGGVTAVALLVLLSSFSAVAATEEHATALTKAQADWVGERIFANECNLDVRCLTSWNAGEDFPSLGIGHFIWYRAGQQERFRESFPALLAFYETEQVTLPAWLAARVPPTQPWPDREAFLAAADGPCLTELRDFLDRTRDVQVRFIIRRLQEALPAMTRHSQRPAEISSLFHALAGADAPRGAYALIDYVNFKGEGTLASERYRGEGWGLLQVLEYMARHPVDEPLLDRFADAAATVLQRRVTNSPPERGEQRWLTGWMNRVDTYRTKP